MISNKFDLVRQFNPSLVNISEALPVEIHPLLSECKVDNTEFLGFFRVLFVVDFSLLLT